MAPTALLELAQQARTMAYTPYSGYRVGAALLCDDGTVFTGCNIENAAYPATICAERTALFKAISEGHRRFTALAIVGGSGDSCGDFAYPCGVCRQALSEFCSPNMPVYFQNGGGQIETHCFSELLPFSFSAAHLQPIPPKKED